MANNKTTHPISVADELLTIASHGVTVGTFTTWDYDLEMFQDEINKLQKENVGELSGLTTTDKSSLVNAINEVASGASASANVIGDLNDLDTPDKDTLVEAINDAYHNSGATITVDDALDSGSTNPVENRAIYFALNDKVNSDDLATINGQALDEGGNIEISGVTEEELQLLADLENEVFKMTASYTSKNSGTYEEGKVITPTATMSIVRRGQDVASACTFAFNQNVSLSEDKKTWTANNSLSSGSVTYTATVTNGSQTTSLPNLTYSFTNYRYGWIVTGEDIPTGATQAEQDSRVLSSLQSKRDIGSWDTSNGEKHELSTIPTLDATNLTSNHAYVFAVRGVQTLVCRENSSSAEVTGCGTGTITIPNECDASLTNTYSYIIVPASSNNWTFKITNA